MPVRNLDEQTKEYFDFTIKGHTYRFTHPTIKEIKEMDELKNDEKNTNEKFFKFISKIDKTSPDWSDVFEKLTVPQLKAFQTMIQEEFGL